MLCDHRGAHVSAHEQVLNRDHSHAVTVQLFADAGPASGVIAATWFSGLRIRPLPPRMPPLQEGKKMRVSRCSHGEIWHDRPRTVVSKRHNSS